MKPRYTMRLCWPDNPDRTDDFVFLVDSKDAGRCYFTRAANNREVWQWTIYRAAHSGMEGTLEEAQRRFKQTYEARRKA